MGRRFLQKEFDKIGKNFMDVLNPKKIKLISSKLGFDNLDDILSAVGEGSLNPQNVLATLYEEKMLDKEAMGYFKKKISAGKQAAAYPINISVLGDNSSNQFREIFRILNALKIPINKFVIDKPAYLVSDRCRLSLMIKDYNELSQVFESLERLECVKKVSRTFFTRKLFFLVSIVATAALWLIHPVLIYMVTKNIPFAETLSFIAELAGFSMLFGLIYYIHRIAHRSFPELEETKYYWPVMLILSTLAFFTIIQEIITLNLNFKWIFLLGLIIIVYAFLASSYLSYKQRHQ
jgi:hypothetical protein